MCSAKRSRNTLKHDLEDYEPGATKQEVFQALEQVVTEQVESKRKTKRRPESPAPSSS